jgi:hypothetical protein
MQHDRSIGLNLIFSSGIPNATAIYCYIFYICLHNYYKFTLIPKETICARGDPFKSTQKFPFQDLILCNQL